MVSMPFEYYHKRGWTGRTEVVRSGHEVVYV